MTNDSEDRLWHRCLAEIPEPAKSQAKAQRLALIDHGATEADAERKALLTAAKWVAERVPHIRAPYLDRVVSRAALEGAATS